MPLIKSLCLNQFLFARPFLNYKDEEVDEKYSVSICIPACATKVATTLKTLFLRLPKFAKHQEIIFIEGNSSDDTWQKNTGNSGKIS